jgi:hypothetical protein
LVNTRQFATKDHVIEEKSWFRGLKRRADLDLSRYFHPHHNPRLLKVSLRLIECGELHQGAIHLLKAVERAAIRSRVAPQPELPSERLEAIAQALRTVVDELRSVVDTLPEDSHEALRDLVEERRHAPGWENWTRLLEGRLMLVDGNREPETGPGIMQHKKAAGS